jgi:hypothetical protein
MSSGDSTPDGQPVSTALVRATTTEKAKSYANAWVARVKQETAVRAPPSPYIETLIRVGGLDYTVWPLVHEFLRERLHPGADAVEAEGGRRGRKAIPRGADAELTDKKRWVIDGKEASWARDFVDKRATFDLGAQVPEIAAIEEAVQEIGELANLSDGEKSRYVADLRGAGRLEGIPQGKLGPMMMVVENTLAAARRQDAAVERTKNASDWALAGKDREVAVPHPALWTMVCATRRA